MIDSELEAVGLDLENVSEEVDALGSDIIDQNNAATVEEAKGEVLDSAQLRHLHRRQQQ